MTDNPKGSFFSRSPRNPFLKALLPYLQSIIVSVALVVAVATITVLTELLIRSVGYPIATACLSLFLITGVLVSGKRK